MNNQIKQVISILGTLFGALLGTLFLCVFLFVEKTTSFLIIGVVAFGVGLLSLFFAKRILPKKDLMIMGIILVSTLMISGGFVLFELASTELKVGVIIVLVVALILSFWIKSQQCPACKRVFAMREVSRELIKEDWVEKTITTSERRKVVVDGKLHSIVEYKKENVPIKVKVYRCLIKCQHCGYEKEVEKTVS